MCDVATIMLVSAGIGAVGNLVQMGSSIASGSAQRKYNEEIAQSAEKQAQAIGDQAHWDILRLRDDVSQFTAGQRAVQAASGMAGSQSALEVLSDTERQARMDEMTIQRNADLQRWQMTDQARLAREAGKNAYTAGWLGAGSSLLGAAGSVADIWARWSPTSRGQTASSSSQNYYGRPYLGVDRGMQSR